MRRIVVTAHKVVVITWCINVMDQDQICMNAAIKSLIVILCTDASERTGRDDMKLRCDGMHKSKRASKYASRSPIQKMRESHCCDQTSR